jgi:hypothetical protein
MPSSFTTKILGAAVSAMIDQLLNLPPFPVGQPRSSVNNRPTISSSVLTGFRHAISVDEKRLWRG